MEVVVMVEVVVEVVEVEVVESVVVVGSGGWCCWRLLPSSPAPLRGRQREARRLLTLIR